MKRKPFFTIISEEAAESTAFHRHVLCPRYDECLDEAVLKNSLFSCNRCPYKKHDIIAYKIHDGEEN